MDRSDVISLISVTTSIDNRGVPRKVEQSKQVYCSVSSVSASEFFEGGRNGLNPEYRMTMFRYDYNGEPIVEYNGQRYSIYRTYIGKNDMIELYVERKGGTNGTANHD